MPEIQIEQIRYELTWHLRHKVMYPNLPFESIKLKNDSEGIHFGLYANDKLTAVVSIFNDGKIYQFRKLATLTEEQGKGFGSLLLKYVISFVKHDSGEKLWCNARVSASKFYSKFGFLQLGSYFVENDIDFVIMELDLKAALDA
ncbi:putative GNAT family N-acyltransferase [Pedobacter sp. UYP24]